MSSASHQLHRVRDRSDVGAARRAVQELARRAGVPRQSSEPAQVAVTELGTNLLVHAKDGYLLLRPLDDPRGLELLAVDHGPGIADPARALSGGTTVAGLGIGLGSVQRLATSFELYSRVGEGTVVLARFCEERSGIDPAAAGRFLGGGVSVAVVPGYPNGDGWAVTGQGAGCSVLVVDGLGHGPAAHEAARAALAAFDAGYDGDLEVWLRSAHAAMRGTRGGVAAVAKIDPAGQRVCFAGVGNVHGRVVAGGRTSGLVSFPGTIGINHQPPRSRLVEAPWPAGATLLLWSDGIRSDVTLHQDPGLLAHHPTVVAALLHRDFARGTDDATVVVVQDRVDGRQ
jgi:anti-sigma regulatory factor (Ser/Thr protein kinase)